MRDEVEHEWGTPDWEIYGHVFRVSKGTEDAVQRSAGAHESSRFRANAHLSDDETVAKMGHPNFVMGQIWAPGHPNPDVGHPPRISPWIVLVDLDNGDCAVTAKNAWLPASSPFMCLRIAVRELEAWLLADRERFSSYFGVNVDLLPVNPDGLDDPKLTLINLIRRSRRSAIRADMIPDPKLGQTSGPAYTARLIEYIGSDEGWRVEVAAEQSPSLSRAIVAIRDLREIAP